MAQLGHGNWLSSQTTISGSTVTDTRLVNNANEYTQINVAGQQTPLTHDGNGNLSTDGTHDYTYTEDNLLESVTPIGGPAVLQLVYDAPGNRVVSSRPATSVILSPYFSRCFCHEAERARSGSVKEAPR